MVLDDTLSRHGGGQADGGVRLLHGGREQGSQDQGLWGVP